MRNNEYNLFVSEKKKPSFAEWTMQNGVSLNQTTQKPLTLVEVAPKATERATSSAPTTIQTRDPFLEGFYSTEDKPETERKTYLQHRTPINAETPKINSTYRQTNPYGSPVKIVGNNVTGKDYDAFLEGFNDPYGEKREQAQLREAQAQRERNTSIPTSVNNRTLASRKTTDPFLEGFAGKSKQSQNKPQNQDAAEFGGDSETYKILQDLSSRWYKTSDPAEKDRLHKVAEEVRMYHRQGTPIVDRHDAIMGLLHENKKIAQDYQRTMTEGLPGFLYRMSDGNYMLDSSTYLIGMVNKGEWDYKYNDDWQVKYDYFDGKDMDAPECNYRNWTPWMYFDGRLISADKLGNMNMAYVGKNMGLPEWVYKNITTTDKDDAEWVQYGIDLAEAGR